MYGKASVSCAKGFVNLMSATTYRVHKGEEQIYNHKNADANKKETKPQWKLPIKLVDSVHELAVLVDEREHSLHSARHSPSGRYGDCLTIASPLLMTSVKCLEALH